MQIICYQMDSNRHCLNMKLRSGINNKQSRLSKRPGAAVFSYFADRCDLYFKIY